MKYLISLRVETVHFSLSRLVIEFCLPNGPPPRCTEGDWNKLLDVFEGVQCPIIAQVMVDEMPEFMVGGPAGLPPAYLSV